MSIIEVDNWLEIEGSFSSNAYRKSYPNDTLIYNILSHYLAEENRDCVCYGLSSIQARNNEEGLHAFKTKMGFEAKPVHRAFLLNPFLRPLANKFTYWGVNKALRLKPANPFFKKVDGMLAQLVDAKHFNN